MNKGGLKKGFGVYFDPTKSTSGQRFFDTLCQELSKEAVPLNQHPAAILFNVSAPIQAILNAKLRRQKVVLRIDGLYFDRLSSAFLSKFNWPLCQLFSIGVKYKGMHDLFAFWANFFNQNYTAFARILLSDHIIYQSKFSQEVHTKFFKKPYDIIVNGSVYQREDKSSCSKSKSAGIRLVTIYDEWKPAKRINDLVEFVQWACEQKGLPLRLTILGYTGKIPVCVSPQIKTIIETSPYIQTLPRFNSFSGEIRDALFDSDIYITFTYRDPCPNAVVEAMAHGLPVVGVASGGVPDIVGNAGMLLRTDDFTNGFYSCHRYECDFKPINFEQVLDAVLEVSSNRELFKTSVRERFTKDLEIKVVAARYAEVMTNVINSNRLSIIKGR